jgi:arylsulfatase A-like enzyme
MRRIVVTLRSCPTRLLGPYGCEWVETPTLDRLASEGVVFDGHYATKPFQSYAGPALKFDSPELAEKLKTFSNTKSVDCSIDIDPYELPWDDLHDGPLTLTDDNREAFFDTLAGRVNDFDEQLTAFVDRLREYNLLETSLLVITALAGFPAGEHGLLGLSQSRLHEELVHLPLIVRFPDRRLAGYRVAGFTTPDDLTDPLETLILGERRTREFVASRRENEVCLRTADSCLILPLNDNPQPALLFDRPDDRFEVNNLATSQPDRVEELKTKFFFTVEGAENAE